MAQPFRRWTNVGSKGSLFGMALAMAGAMWTAVVYVSSSYGTNSGVTVDQPIPFSHQHHAGVLGIDCRYCHTSVEYAPFAGIPATKVCMNCHSQMWVGSQTLAPVRRSYYADKSITWSRVYNIPGFVYFDHSIHVQKGVGCTTCHGRIDKMPITYQEPTLLMKWCIDCHRDPAEHVRPREKVFDMAYQAPADQPALGRQLVEEYAIRSPRELTSCSVCHR
jgi:hypothetical protein